MRSYGPAFRWAFQMTEDEQLDLPLDRWQQYREFVDGLLGRQG